MTRRAPLHPLAAGLALLAVLHAPALQRPALGERDEAARRRYWPAATEAPARDVDETAEERSTLWENALRPHRAAQKQRIARARTLLGRGDAGQLDQAGRLLEEAIAMDPGLAEAHFWLAEVRRRQSAWADCAGALRRALALEPSFQPPRDEYPEPWALRLLTADCLARAGQHEAALTHYRRILTQSPGGHFAVLWGLAENYMALGRLDEAIDALQGAARLRPYDPRVDFALAVAYDRDERLALARGALETALARDGKLSQITRAEHGHVPAADQHYFLGLARKTLGDVSWAIAHFRRYQEETGDGPWSRRVRAHLQELSAQLAPEHELVVGGSAHTDENRVRAVLATARAALQDCVEATPNLLLRVSLHLVTPPVAGDSAHAPVRVDAGLRFATDDEQLRRAVSCTERVARGLRLPRPSGPPGSFVTLDFPLIAR